MHPNEQVLRDIDEAQVKGDVEGFMSRYADDIVVHMPGKSSLAGTHSGKATFMELFGKFNELVPEYTFESHAYFADDEHGVLLQKSHWKRGDQTLDTNDTFVCHFRDGKVSEMWLLTDKPEEVDAFLG
jgi:ketosteroid isomerase-like protein